MSEKLRRVEHRKVFTAKARLMIEEGATQEGKLNCKRLKQSTEIRKLTPTKKQQLVAVETIWCIIFQVKEPLIETLILFFLLIAVDY